MAFVGPTWDKTDWQRAKVTVKAGETVLATQIEQLVHDDMLYWTGPSCAPHPKLSLRYFSSDWIFIDEGHMHGPVCALLPYEAAEHVIDMLRTWLYAHKQALKAHEQVLAERGRLSRPAKAKTPIEQSMFGERQTP